MLQRLTSPTLLEFAYEQIAALFHAHAEWLYVASDGTSQSLRRDEFEVAIVHKRLVFSCWTEKGNRLWRILAWNWNGLALELEASRRMGRDCELIQLIPRTSAKHVAATIRAARQLRCERLAQLAAALEVQTTIERLSLSRGTRPGQPGRHAQILLRRKRERIAVTGPVVASQPAVVDAFLSSALLWFQRTADRIKPPHVEQLWLIVSPELLKSMLYRVSLLRGSLRNTIKVFTVDNDLTFLTKEKCPDKQELWKKKLARFPPVAAATPSELSVTIIAEAPHAIDVVHARHGETLRYFGLPFARVRSLLSHQQVWFGIDRAHRRLLDESTWNEWQNLLRDLREHRSATALDHRHAFYRAAPEAWLESLLRRDITRLDPGLIIAPLHAQFRTARGAKLGIRPIDLLALRQDGRLVVIELKVSEDREHVLQGADYWRRVEAHRRRGHIAKARLFGDRKIRDEAPLVYLVAPTLRVHPSFQTLAHCISRDIEIYRFDINEDWRSGVRVMRRHKTE
ncbi:MAG TPA: hypothetical protein VJT69_16735 [Pyrinomonadaceae bacterium]|nr:hypothetical protein [Pyrinomonadaceae bacterium]